MTNLQKIQQETEEVFYRDFPTHSAHTEKCIHNGCPPYCPVVSFIHSRESIAYKAGKEDGYNAGLDATGKFTEKVLKELREKMEKMRLPIIVKGRSILLDKKYLKAISKVLALIDEEIKRL